jgi:protein TonB
VAPRYPARARSEGKESLVVLEVAVRKDGTVGEAKPLRVDEKGYGFESAAIEALKQWKFRPASKEGEPVEVRCSLIFDFTLDEEPEPATPAPDAAAAPSRPGR